MQHRLERGAARLPEAFRRRQADFVLSRQVGDGGFRGRGTTSDLYYTRFALQTLFILGDAAGGTAPGRARARRYVAGREPSAGTVEALDHLHVVRMLEEHGAPPLEAAKRHERFARLQAAVESCRTSDGGYSASPGGRSSVYHVFVAGLCYELLGKRQPDRAKAVQLVISRQRGDGGFADGAGADQGQTNITAGAVCGLAAAGFVGRVMARRSVDFLKSMQRGEGGLAAYAGAPHADLLSTFTGLWALVELGALKELHLSSLGRYVRSLALKTGGFLGSADDGESDVEYTFYGVAALAALAEAAGHERTA